MSSELNNIQSEEFTEDLVQKRMEEVKKQYPNLTEEQYSEIEERLRIFVNGTVSTEDTNMSEAFESSLEGSLTMKSLSTWFPLFMSFSIWMVLEFLRSILFAPISGVFSYIFFKFRKESAEENSLAIN